MNILKLQRQIEKWENSRIPPKWPDLQIFMEKLGFSVTEDGGSRYKIYHEILEDFPGLYSGVGLFTFDKPHRKGDPVDKGAFKKKILPAMKYVLSNLREQDINSNTNESSNSETIS